MLINQENYNVDPEAAETSMGKFLVIILLNYIFFKLLIENIYEM